MVNITDPISSLNFGPDGGHGLAINMNISAAAGLSGIQSFNTSFLAGVFLNGHEGDMSHTAPATLDLPPTTISRRFRRWTIKCSSSATG